MFIDAVFVRKTHLFGNEQPAPADAPNTMRGRVWDIGYLGGVSIYKVRLDDGVLMKASVSNQSRAIERTIGWNDRVWLSWPAEAAIVLTR